MTDILTLHKKLLSSASPSGFEGNIAKTVTDLARPLCDEVYADVLGNVICHIKGKGRKILFTAHMDVVGFMVKSVDEKGFLRVIRLGSPRPFAVINARVRFNNGTTGMIRPVDAEKTLKKAPSALTFGDLYIDIGAASKESAEKLAPAGSVCVYEGVQTGLLCGNVLTPYADDLIGCAALLCAMESCRKAQNDLYFVFTAQEEVGCRGAGPAAAAIDPDIAVNCDVAEACDDPQSKKQNDPLILGKGPAVKLFDASVIPQTGLSRLLLKIAEIEKIPCRKEISERIGTDASEIQRASGGVCTAGVSIPLRNLHTPTEVFNKKDAEGAARLISAFARAKL
ncbi:MAG: M20/M25/M40 family metallo-hydrolase [Clostridia bacterium]|nr:M20/M25/M40 family metallo-hydrolase [Clostridia bacterium]